MAAPICTHIGKLLETMRNAMVDLLFIWIGFVIRLADAFRDDFRVAFSVAGVLAIRALHTG